MKKAIFAMLTVCLMIGGSAALADPVELPEDPFNLLVSNLTGGDAYELDMAGELQSSFPFPAEGSGGIAVGGPSGNVFLGQDISGTVSEYSRSTASLVNQWSLPSVWDVGVSPVMDRLYAVSSAGHLGVVDLPGGEMVSIGGSDLTNPYSLDFTQSGDFYVTDDLTGNNAGIVHYSADASTATSYIVPGIAQPRGVAAIENENALLVADLSGAVHLVGLAPDGTGVVANSITDLSYLGEDGSLLETQLIRPNELEMIGNTVFIGDLGDESGESGFIVAFDLVDNSGYVISNEYVTGASGLAGAEPQAAVVPEPTTMAMLGIGFVGLAAARRRRR